MTNQFIGSTTFNGNDLAIPLHRHKNTAEFLFVESGTLVVELLHERISARSGELIFLPAGHWHQLDFSSTEQQAVRKLAFNISALEKDCSLQITKPDNPIFVASLFTEMERQLAMNASAGEKKCMLLVSLLLMELEPVAAEEPVSASVPFEWSHLLHELEETCHLPFSLTQTAMQAGLSKFHFSRKFKEICGVTPLQFVISCRMDRARHLLQTTPGSVCEIADACGYKSVTQFHSVFVQHTGDTPKRFRQKHIQKTPE